MPGRKGKMFLMLVFSIILVLTPAAGCRKKGQPQRKPAEVKGQEVRIAVSMADMGKEESQAIKKAMERRQSGRPAAGQQEGQGGQAGGQQSGQQGGGGQQAMRQDSRVIPVQVGGEAGGQGAGGQAGGQGPRVNITWLDAKNDPARQEKDLDQLAGRKVSAVILQPVDPAAGPGLIRSLARKGIKVVTLEALPPNSPVDGYVASDHARAGELQARYLLGLAQARPAGMMVAVLQGDKNDQAAREVTSSLLSNLNGSPAVKVIQVKDHPGGDPQMAAATVEQTLTSTGGQVDAFVATDGRMAVSAAEVLKNRGLKQRVVTVGVGADEKTARALAAGEHDAEVDLMPDLLAQYAYDAGVGLATTGHWQYDTQLKNGDFDVPAKITPVRLITKNEVYLLEQRFGKLTGQEGGGQGGQSGQGGQGSSGEGGSGSQDKDKSGSGEKKESQGSGGGGKGEQAGKGKKKTTLKITTQDGKTVEVQIDGEIKKIETVEGGGAAGGGAQ